MGYSLKSTTIIIFLSMKQILQTLQNKTTGYFSGKKQALKSLSVVDKRSTYGRLRQSPSQSLILEAYKSEIPHQSTSGIIQAVDEYQSLVEKKRMHVKSVSDTFNFLANTKHEIGDIKSSLCKIMLSKEPVDAVFFSKGIYQSVTEKSPLEDQIILVKEFKCFNITKIEFFHFMLNTNLLPPFTEVYIQHLLKISEKNQKPYSRLPMNLSFKSFNTMHRAIDLSAPNLPNSFLKMVTKEKSKLVKELYKEKEEGHEERFLYLQGLSYQGLTGSENIQWLLLDKIIIH